MLVKHYDDRESVGTSLTTYGEPSPTRTYHQALKLSMHAEHCDDPLFC
jgi:hypothetical protein